METPSLQPPAGIRDHIRGPITAAVNLALYCDFECPDCGKAYIALCDVRHRLGSRICFLYRHRPQSEIHPHARHAAEAAEAAGRQGRFWEMHDLLFEHQGALSDAHLVEYAATLQLDTTQFLRDMAGHVHTERIEEDGRTSILSGVEATPAFFINGVRYNGPWDSEALIGALKQAERWVEQGRESGPANEDDMITADAGM